MISKFNEYFDGLNKYIMEMSGYSEDSNKQLNKLISYIKKCVIEKRIHLIDLPDNIKSFKCECYQLDSNYKKIIIDGETIHLQIIIINTYDDSIKDYIGTAEIIPMVGKNSKKMEYVLNAYVLYNNWSFDKYNYKVIGHEMMHEYNYQKEFFGKYGKNIFDKWDKSYEWRNFYSLVCRYINSHKNDNDNLIQFCYGIYAMDVREINAFSQELNIELQDTDNKSDIDKKCKESDIYIWYNNAKKLFELLHNKSFDYEYIVNQLLLIKDVDEDIVIPNKNWLIRTLDKRIDKYQKNIGDAIIRAKERILKDGENIDESILIRLEKPNFNFYKLN